MTRPPRPEAIRRGAIAAYPILGLVGTCREFNVSSASLYMWLRRANIPLNQQPAFEGRPRSRKKSVYDCVMERAMAEGIDLEERSLQNLIYNFAEELKRLPSAGASKLFPHGVLRQLYRLEVVTMQGGELLNLTAKGASLLKEVLA